MTEIKISQSEEETRQIGRELGMKAQSDQVYCLNGDLGAGKTMFTQGFAQGIGVQEYVNSPTFTIVQEYMGKIPFYHFDVYRIEELDEMYEIGLDEYMNSGGVCLIEWADKIHELLPDYCVWITLEKDLEKGFDYRQIKISDIGGKI